MWILCPAEDSLDHQVFFSLKNNEKIFMNVVCCSRDWRFKDQCYILSHILNCSPLGITRQIYFTESLIILPAKGD